MIIDYEGSPVHDCMHLGQYYTVKGVDVDKKLIKYK